MDETKKAPFFDTIPPYSASVDVTVTSFAIERGDTEWRNGVPYSGPKRVRAEIEYNGRKGVVRLEADEVANQFLRYGVILEAGSVVSLNHRHVIWEGDPEDE